MPFRQAQEVSRERTRRRPRTRPVRPAGHPHPGRLHCHREYESDLIERRLEPDGSRKPRWCCPTDGCGGRGFGFDILPCDPTWRSEDGLSGWFDDGYDEDDREDPTPDPDRTKGGDEDIPY
jgi:hypothetical protein